MRKLLLLVTTLVFAFSLAACDLFGGTDEPPVDGITTVTINGLVDDREVLVETVVNLFEGVTVTADDGNTYTEVLTVSSDACTVEADNTVTSAIPAECDLTYSAVVDGILARTTITLKFYKEDVVVDLDKFWFVSCCFAC